MTEKSDIRMLIEKAQVGDKDALGAILFHYDARFRALAGRRHMNQQKRTKDTHTTRCLDSHEGHTFLAPQEFGLRKKLLFV